MKYLALKFLIAVGLMSVSAMAIEYYQAPGLVGYVVGLISGASILALFEALERIQ